MSKCGKGCMPECQYFTTGGCVSPFNCPYNVEEIYSNSATSNTACYAGTSYTEAQPDESEAGIRKWYREQVGHEPANYDAAALKAYIAHLEEENKKLEHRAEVYYDALLSAAAYGDTPPEHYIEQAEKELADEGNND